MSKKRPYRLGKREASIAETRRRIIEAASELYVAQGIKATSMLAIARHADVAPGTVRHHFGNADDLVGAVIEKWSQELDRPSPGSVDLDAPLVDRLGSLFAAVYGLYARSDWIYLAIEADFDHPVLDRARQSWESDMGEMMMRALGEHAEREGAIGVVSAFLHPPTWMALRASLPDRDVAHVAAGMAAWWIEAGSQRA